MAKPYHELSTSELLQRLSDSPPDTPDWIHSKAELDRRAAEFKDIPEHLREREFVESLADVTRAERRLLLVVSTIVITVINAGLVPQKIDALGITLTIREQRSLYVVAAAIIAYLLAAFVIYARADARAWREDQNLLALQKARVILKRITASGKTESVGADEVRAIGQVAEEMFVKQWPKKRWVYGLKHYFDVWAPVAVGGYALVTALAAAFAG